MKDPVDIIGEKLDIYQGWRNWARGFILNAGELLPQELCSDEHLQACVFVAHAALLKRERAKWFDWARNVFGDGFGEFEVGGGVVPETEEDLRTYIAGRVAVERDEAHAELKLLQTHADSLSAQSVDLHARLNALKGDADDYPRMMFHVTGQTKVVRNAADERALGPVSVQGKVVRGAPNHGWFRMKGECDAWAAAHPEAVGTIVVEESETARQQMARLKAEEDAILAGLPKALPEQP